MIKRWMIALLCMGMLASSAGACAQDYYTLPEIREQAAGGWQGTYTDRYGRETVVDVDIDVFGEDVAPVLRMTWHDPQEVVKDVNSPFDASNRESERGNKRTWLYEGIGEVDEDTVYGAEYGNTMRYGEFLDLVEEIKALYGSEQTYLTEYPELFSVVINTHKKTGELVVEPFYNVWLWPTEYGLPELTDASWSFAKDGYGPGTTTGIALAAKSMQEYHLVMSEFDVDEVLAQDIPLCALDKVIESLEKAIEAGVIYGVDALRFGYSVYADPQDDFEWPGDCFDILEWYYVPSWVATCGVRHDPASDGDLSRDTRDLTINAQTGEMFDFYDTSFHGTGDYRYKGFIAWEDVVRHE